MDIATITTLISTLGFPIVCVIALCWFIWRIYRKSEEREAELRQEIKDCQAVNAEAIKTLAHYADRLGTIEQDVKEIKDDIIILTAK